jgi:hypothetical protein
VSYGGPKPRIVQTFGVPVTVTQHEQTSNCASSTEEDRGDGVPTKASAFEAERKLAIDIPWHGHYYRGWRRGPRGFGRCYGRGYRRFGWHGQRRWRDDLGF